MKFLCSHSNSVTKVVLHVEYDIVISEEASRRKRSYNKTFSAVNHFDLPIVNEIKVIKTASRLIYIFTLIVDPHVQFGEYFAHEYFIGKYLLRVVIKEESEFTFLLVEYCIY